MKKGTDREKIKYKKTLSCRETEYLSLAALGYKNKETAGILCVSYFTVKKTFESIFKKLSAKDRANAVAIAFIFGILTADTLLDIKIKYHLNT